jgi:cobalamin synthase
LIALLVLILFGVANGFTEVVMMTAIHQNADAGYQGRVFGVGSTIWRTTMLGAVALAPAVDAIASPSEAITVAAVVLLSGAIFVQVCLRPSPQTAPAPA